MPETDLHIVDRLKKLLPPLTADERKQLKENIEADGKVLDAILWWFDGTKKAVIEGMHRWDILRGMDNEVPYRAQEMKFADYDEAELWILNHQLGRRNMTPLDMKRVAGEIYNRVKGKRGGGRTPQSDPPKGQNDPLLPTTAEKIGEKAGISPSTVKRAGARVEAESKLTKAAKLLADKATDKEVKQLAKLASGDQDAVARALRTGQAASVGEAIKISGVQSEAAQRATGGRQKAKGKTGPSAAQLVDLLTKRHIGHIARGLTNIAEINGGEGAQFKAADAGLNQLIRALQEMRKGKQ